MDEVKAVASARTATEKLTAMRSKMEECGVDGEFFVLFFCFATFNIPPDSKGGGRYTNKLIPIYAPQPVLESTIPIAPSAR